MVRIWAAREAVLVGALINEGTAKRIEGGVVVKRSNLFVWLRTAAILGVGVVYGTDAFFALVGRRALERSTDESMAEVMGRLHETADVRMPAVGAAGMVATAGMALAAGTSAGRLLSLAALAAQAGFLGLYTTLSAPINKKLTIAAQDGRTPDDARTLQRRWDKVVRVRVLLLTTALACLATAEPGH